MCFSVGVGINALPWFQPSASGKEIVLRPLPRPLPVHSIRWRALPQIRQNGLDRVRLGDICDHPQGAAAQRADRNIDIKYTLEPLCPTQWRARQSLIDTVSVAVCIVGFFDLLRDGFAEPGTTARLNGELGAKTPWYRVRLDLGLGTSAANRARKSA